MHDGLELGDSGQTVQAEQSSSIRAFQDLKMRLPNLFNANSAVKMMEFR